MTDKELIGLGVKKVSDNYFSVQDIRDNHPELKVDVDKIEKLNEELAVKAEFVHKKTEFDKTIGKVFPKK